MLSRCYCSTQRLSKEFRERNLWRKRAFLVLILPKSQGRGSKLCSGRHCKWLAFSLTIRFSHPLATCIFSFAAEKIAIFLWLLSDAFKKLRKEVNCNWFQQVVRYLIIYSACAMMDKASEACCKLTSGSFSYGLLWSIFFFCGVYRFYGRNYFLRRRS